MITFKICHDLSHDKDDVFKHAFALSFYSSMYISKKDKRKAIEDYMKLFGPEGQRWTYSAPDAWFVYVRFREESDAMMFKLMKD